MTKTPMTMNKTTETVPDEVAKRFGNISIVQYKILCFTAYRGTFPYAGNKWLMERVESSLRFKKGQAYQEYENLRKLGYFTSEENIKPSFYFDLIIPMIRHFPEWVDIFTTFGNYGMGICDYLWKVSKAICEGDMKKAAAVKPPRNADIWPYFAPLLFREGSDAIVALLSDDDKRTALDYALCKSLSNDALTESFLKKARTAAGKWLPNDRETIDQIDCMCYFANGTLPQVDEKRKGHTAWEMVRQAVVLLYENRLSESMEAFLAALSLKRGSDSRNCFSHPLLNWFYAVCLLLCAHKMKSNKARKALENMRGDSRFKFEDIYTPVRVLTSYYSLTDQKSTGYIASELHNLLNRKPDALVRYLARIVACYFHLPEETISEMFAKESLPKALILQNEMSPVVPMTSSVKESVSKVYSSGGSLSRIPRKESWQMTLSSLTGTILQEEPEAQRQKRIIYFFDGKWLSAFMKQEQMGDGTWGNEQLLSRSTFIEGGYDFTDMTDLKVANILMRNQSKTSDVELVLPLLQHTGRIFTGQYLKQPYQELSVIDEKPFVAFYSRDGRIDVSSNAARTQGGTVKEATLTARDGGYVCVRTNPIQRDILTRLLEIGHFPMSAAASIHRTMDSLEGILEVKSNLSQVESIATMRGSTRLALRICAIKNEKDAWEMEIQAAPNEEGFLRCIPGQGEEDFYDDSMDTPRFIRRDLQKEYDNYMELYDFANDELHLEFISSTKCSIWSCDSLLQILEWAYDNRDKCLVEWPEGQPLRFKGHASMEDVDISVKSDIDWFAIEGEISIGNDKVKLGKLLDAMRSSEQGFIKLDDQDYIRMTDTLRKHLEELDRMLTGRGGSRVKKIPKYQIGALAKVLGSEGGFNAKMDEGFTGLLDRMQSAYDSVPEVPSTLKATLRPYQKEGYVWMKRLDGWGAGACLADDMGLGKTIQSLAFILSKASEGPSIVVAPKSVLPNWEIESTRFAPSLNVKVLNNEPKRKECIESASAGDLILVTYGVLGTECEALASREWNVVCLDEAHQIKNRNTQVSSAAMELRSKSRLILTGTPLQNHLGELWNLFQFINPGLLGSWTEFKARYLGTTALDEENRSFLKDTVQPFILRRTKEEVLSDLPDKTVYEKMVDLSPEEMSKYESMRIWVESHLSGGKKKGAKSADKVSVEFFAELTKLRLAACSMSLVDNAWSAPSSKTMALKEIIEELSSNESNRVLIFSQFTSYLTQVKAMLDKENLRYLYLDGQTELQHRADLVAQFQSGDCPIFLVSIKAGGLGLNLTAANYVILLDPWWNPAIENQAMDRAHRFGQKRNVTVIRLISKHTIEEKILRLHESKQSLSDEIMDGTQYSGQLTMDDVLDMVSPFR